MKSTSRTNGSRRKMMVAIIGSLGIVALGTGIGFAATNGGQKVQTCAATFVTGGGTTASGEQSDPNSLTAGSSVFPIGTLVKVTNPDTKKSVTVRINDKNSFCVAMQQAAFEQIRTPGENLIRNAQVQAVGNCGQGKGQGQAGKDKGQASASANPSASAGGMNDGAMGNGGAMASNGGGNCGGMTSAYNSGILNGNQLNTTVQVPIDISGNALGILGGASASSQGGAFASNC